MASIADLQSQSDGLMQFKLSVGDAKAGVDQLSLAVKDLVNSMLRGPYPGYTRETDPGDDLGKGIDDFRYELNPDGLSYSQPEGPILKGAEGALEEYQKKVKDAAGVSQAAFTTAFNAMDASLNNFVTTGKFSFSEFTRSLLVDLAKIAQQQATSSLLSSLFSAGISYFSGGAAPAYTGYQLGGSLLPSSFQSGVSTLGTYSSPSAHAKGGVFTNSVVSAPTAFGMAGGRLGLMGEAGPEAIMPLTRTAGGALGVRALTGQGGGTAIQINAPVNVTVGDRQDQDGQLDQAALQQNLQRQIQAAAEKAVADSWRPGGVSFRQARA